MTNAVILAAGDCYTPFAVDLSVVVTWTGKFTANGYVPGRLSARLYREPLVMEDLNAEPSSSFARHHTRPPSDDSALIRVPVGYGNIPSVQLCTLTSVGRLVIR